MSHACCIPLLKAQIGMYSRNCCEFIDRHLIDWHPGSKLPGREQSIFVEMLSINFLPLH